MINCDIMKKLLIIPLTKNVLSALAITIFGYVLLFITFIFDFIYQSTLNWIIRLFAPNWPIMQFHNSFIIIIGLISWFVFKSRSKVVYKAIYMAVPVAVILVTVGMHLYQWPIACFSVGGLLCICALYIFYRTKQPWLYYYTVILVGATLAFFTLSGGEI